MKAFIFPRISLMLPVWVGIFLLTGCDEKPEPKEEGATFVVTFHTGEGASTVAAQTIAEGDTVSKPADPTRDGYDFKGWFKEDTYTTAFNFTQEKITANITLYAKWSKIVTHTVTFNTNGGSKVAPIENVAHGTTIERPTTIPTKTDSHFAGWYKEVTLENLFKFRGEEGAEKITSDTTLYAKWTNTSYTVTFESNNGTSIEPQTIGKGGTATQPTEPTRSGYAFKGWYTENTFENLFSFSTAITTDLTLYAKWAQTHTVTFTLSPTDAKLELRENDASGDLITGSNNVFSLPAGTYHYKVSKADYVTNTGSVKVIDQDVKKTVTLQKASSSRTITGITYDLTPLSMEVGKTAAIPEKITLQYSDGTSKDTTKASIIWVSSNTQIATTNQATYKVTGVKAGSATIYPTFDGTTKITGATDIDVTVTAAMPATLENAQQGDIAASIDRKIQHFQVVYVNNQSFGILGLNDGNVYILELEKGKTSADAASNRITSFGFPSDNQFEEKLKSATGLASISSYKLVSNPETEKVYILIDSRIYQIDKGTTAGTHNITKVDVSNVTYVTLSLPTTSRLIKAMTWDNMNKQLLMSTSNPGTTNLQSKIVWKAAPFTHQEAISDGRDVKFALSYPPMDGSKRLDGNDKWSHFTTDAPIEAMSFANIGGVGFLTGENTCSPGFSIKVSELTSSNATITLPEIFNMGGNNPGTVFHNTVGGKTYFFTHDLNSNELERIGQQYIDGTKVPLTDKGPFILDRISHPSTDNDDETEYKKYAGSFNTVMPYGDGKALVSKGTTHYLETLDL